MRTFVTLSASSSQQDGELEAAACAALPLYPAPDQLESCGA